MEERRSQANGFLIAGGLDECEFLEQWQEKVNRLISHSSHSTNLLS